MVKHPCFIILTPGFPANEGDTTVLPFAQSFVQSFCKNYPELKLFVVSFQYPYTLTRYYWHKSEVIDTRDVIYFLSVIVLLLLVTERKLVKR